MSRTKKILLVILSLLPLMITLLLFPLFPDLIPYRNSWFNKYVQLFFPALILIFSIAVSYAHHLCSKKHHDNAALVLERLHTFFLICAAAVYFLFTMTTYSDVTLSTLVHMQTLSFDLLRVIFLVLCILVMFFGNQLPEKNPGDPLAFSTKWTVQSSTIWRKTHTLVGPLLVFAGIICLALCAFLSGWLLAGSCVFLLILPFVIGYIYSYRLWVHETNY